MFFSHFVAGAGMAAFFFSDLAGALTWLPATGVGLRLLAAVGVAAQAAASRCWVVAAAASSRWLATAPPPPAQQDNYAATHCTGCRRDKLGNDWLEWWK